MLGNAARSARGDAESASGRSAANAGRNLVPGRSPHLPKELPRAAMGAARNAAASARRPTLCKRPFLRRDLPGQGKGRGAGASLCRHRDDATATASRRYLAPCRKKRTPYCCSIMPGGTRPQSSSCRRTSRRSCCRRARQKSIRSRTSGSICAKTGSRTASSKTTTPSSTRPATLGGGYSIRQKPSHQSACETGRTSVTPHDHWYYLPIFIILFYLPFSSNHLYYPFYHLFYLPRSRQA